MNTPADKSGSIYDRPTPRCDDAFALGGDWSQAGPRFEVLARRLEQELETCRDAHMANCLAADTLRTEIRELRNAASSAEQLDPDVRLPGMPKLRPIEESASNAVAPTKETDGTTNGRGVDVVKALANKLNAAPSHVEPKLCEHGERYNYCKRCNTVFAPSSKEPKDCGYADCERCEAFERRAIQAEALARSASEHTKDAERYRYLHNGDVDGLLIMRGHVDDAEDIANLIDGEDLDAMVDAAICRAERGAA